MKKVIGINSETTKKSSVVAKLCNKEKIFLDNVHDDVKKMFREACFAEWNGEWVPVLVLSPFDITERNIQDQWYENYETFCELGSLPMVICSESIETVSLSGQTKFGKGNDGDGYSTNTLPSRYRKREKPEELGLSLHQYFHKTKNNTNNRKEFIPHYVGGSGQPVFPVTDSYARSELLKHKPWSAKNPMPANANWTVMFEEFRNSDDCPISVKVSYERAKRIHEDRKKGIKEPFQADIEESAPTDNICDEEVDEVIALSETLGYTEDAVSYTHLTLPTNREV